MSSPPSSVRETRIAAAARAWPGVTVDEAAFAQLITDDTTHVDDLFLATACGAGDARAFEHFERVFVPAIDRAIAHLARDGVDRDEVLQRLRQKLFVGGERTPRIREYSGRGPLAGWLRVAAVREALNLRRELKPEAHANEDEEVLGDVAPSNDPELALARAHHGTVLSGAIREALAALPADDRLLLRMRYLDGLEMEEIGRVLGVHRSSASRALSKARELVLKETRRRVSAVVRGSPSEIESVLRLAQSDLDVSLQRAFR
ncbi:MAG: sigma-70 family RNA polymerase sigma factor [Polyangiales bacterium]